MSQLDGLRRMLAAAFAEPTPPAAPDTTTTAGLDDAIRRLGDRARAGSACREPVDLQRDAVLRFLDTRRVASLRDARLIAFGLTLPTGDAGQTLMDHRAGLELLLASADAWLAEPRRYRRCYQGLLHSYFAHDADGAGESSTARANWLRLRAYLLQRAPATRDKVSNPDWVRTLAAHPDLFGETPCAGFVSRLLAGDRREVEALCTRLGIGATSWFLRDLVQAQVQAGIALDHDAYGAALSGLLALLDSAPAWRDTGLAALLERQARRPEAPLHEGLRDALAAAWGCPWRAEDGWHWDGIDPAAHQLAADWIKAHLIDLHFARLADGSGPRRAAFWKRYTATIQDLALAGPTGAGWPAWTAALATPAEAGGTALLIRLGCASLVAFADPAQPLYGYDLRRPLPYDTTRPLAVALDALNSLCHPSRALCLAHRDGIDGWRQWEQLFAAALADTFWLRGGAAPAANRSAFVDLSDDIGGTDDARAGRPIDPLWNQPAPGEDVHWQTAEAASVPYSRPDLQVLARVHGLQVVDESGQGVRVSGAAIDRRIATVLLRWGFTEAGAGAWRRKGRSGLLSAA